MKLHPVVLVLLIACAKPAPDAAPAAPASSAPAPPPPASTAPTPPAVSAAPSASASAAPRAPAWNACKSDAECTFVSLGCCETTPVNRAHAGEMQKKLDASGKMYCPPKSACGPGPDGTWNGTPGVCRNGICAKP